MNLKRIESFFAVVVSALALAFLVGRKEEAACPIPYKKSIQYPAVSTFRGGFDRLRKLLIQAQRKAFLLLCKLLRHIASQRLPKTAQKIIH